MKERAKWYRIRSVVQYLIGRILAATSCSSTVSRLNTAYETDAILYYFAYVGAVAVIPLRSHWPRIIRCTRRPIGSIVSSADSGSSGESPRDNPSGPETFCPW